MGNEQRGIVHIATMDLNRAATFVRVVETGGFTRAAEALGLPPSSISRSVSKLEQDLGITLLERTTRKVSMTEAGRAFFERAREALAGLEEANSLALDAAQAAHGTVRLAVPMEFGSTHGALFTAFLVEHPRIRIEVTFTNRGAELVGDLVDIAIAIGRLPDSSLVAKRLGQATYRLYAAPSYIARQGQPRTFPDVAKHAAIVTRAIGGEGRWELTGPRGLEHVDVQARLIGDHIQFVAEAALAGLGIAQLPVWIGDRGVREGTLVPILPRFSTEMPLHVLTHGGRHLPRRVALVRDYLFTNLGRHCTGHPKS
jgi:DNA-binding transcriptional LysR family regulator